MIDLKLGSGIANNVANPSALSGLVHRSIWQMTCLTRIFHDPEISSEIPHHVLKTTGVGLSPLGPDGGANVPRRPKVWVAKPVAMR